MPLFYWTATVTWREVALDPIVTDTGTFPEGEPSGIRTLIWNTPMGSRGAAPAYKTSAVCPTTLTCTAFTGEGNGVEITKAPGGSCGVSVPSPVPNNETID